MSPVRILKFSLFVVIFVLFSGSRLTAQTLDQQAWNEVWDRFDKIFPHGNATNIVHALEVPIPATWADAADLDTLRDLQRIAGAIPEEKYVFEPSRMQRTLQDIYTEVVLSVELPNPSPEQRRNFQAAIDKFEAARAAYEARATQFDTLWAAEVARATASGRTLDSRAVLQFRQAHPNFFDSVVAQMNLAMSDVQRFDTDAPLWANAVRALRSEYSYSAASTAAPGIWTYHGGTSIMKTIAADCTDGSDAGFEKLTFDSNTMSTTIRNSGWNGGGGWGGSFFSINAGASGSNYSNVVTSASDSVSLKFCKMTYIPLYAGQWLSIPFLQAIDRGEYKLKQAKLSQDLQNKKILGPDGMIPRLVKGAIVARNISFEAKLGTTSLNEVKSHIDGSGGVRVGPWSIGGGGSSDQYSRTYTAQNGAYGRSTNFTVPAIIAIITEPTNDGPAQPGAAGTKGRP